MYYQFEDIKKEIENEGGNRVIPNDARCEMCFRKKGDICLIGSRREISEAWQVHFVAIHYHKVEQKCVFLCDRCHYYYHIYQFLSESALLDWTFDILYRKGR